MKSRLQEKVENLIAVFLIVKNISGYNMRIFIGIALMFISIVITILVAIYVLTSTDEQGKENEL